MNLHSMMNRFSAQILMIGVVILLMACGGGNASPQSVVEEFIKAGADGKFDELKPLCAKAAPEELCNPNADDRAEFVSIMKTVKIVGEPKVEGNQALVKIAISSGGETAEANLPLVKQGDTWLLSGEPERVES
ncbi:DUF4878 domain-containing protein [Acaryochloris sp. CCMEE 5410]|uniref:DUF4878 domain-containing protein n=1 Tax=Acaryochloris sp. CCMEE 5410 TaxID=310037 RepID=UPI000494CA6B|nr:DUF4878 domain-containing protein [Acaryochloris sp. CCMEE 5410]KAI9133063.1 DUF4878 domain-containing protein [Acaryochloris sp. CCMEE 5410]